MSERERIKRQINSLKNELMFRQDLRVDNGMLPEYADATFEKCTIQAELDYNSFDIRLCFSDKNAFNVSEFHKIFTPETLEAIHKVLNDKINEIKTNQSPD